MPKGASYQPSPYITPSHVGSKSTWRPQPITHIPHPDLAVNVSGYNKLMSIPTSHIKRPYYNPRKDLFWFSKIHGYMAFARTVHLANNESGKIINRPQMDAFWLRELVRLYERVLVVLFSKVSKRQAILDDVRREQREAVRLLRVGMTTRWKREVNRYWERKALENAGLDVTCHTDESCFYEKLKAGDSENFMSDEMDLDGSVEGLDVAMDVDDDEGHFH